MSSALKMVERDVVEVVRVRRTQSPRKVTIGDLVAAAFDATGGDAQKAKALLASRELSRALGCSIKLA